MTEVPNQPAPPSRLRTLLAPLLIVAAALVYYGSYLGYWFNPHDEGGTAAFIAKRLLDGEVPLRDVELGYNVMWFWPIVGLFKIGGVNFLLMRAYFFALATITALCGWTLVRRVTRSEWLALAVGLALVAFPGSQFKNYNPLLCIANMLCIATAALAAVDTPARFWRRAGLGGAVLGLSFLVRIDIGFLFGAMWAGLFALRLFDTRLAARGRWVDTLAAAAVLASGVVLTHAPVYAIARSQGFDRQFVRQYPGWLDFLTKQAGVIGPKAAPAPGAAARKKPPRPANVPPVSRATLPRVSWASFVSFQDSDKSALFALTYLPLLTYVGLIGVAAFGALRALLRREFALDHPATLALLLLGGSLTTFPQFFFFRPDRPHLSEFMPGFIAATTCAVMLLSMGLPRVGRLAIAAFFAAHFCLFGWFALDHYSAGTIAARITTKPNKRMFFEAANGVRVWVPKKDFAKLDGVRRAIVGNARPGEWVVCYPYQPGYNLMTDRPTYERDLYMDNATAPRDWAGKAIARIERKRPAVIVIDERAINVVEFSRFSWWAKPVYEYVRANYHHAGTFDTTEVYARDPLPEPKAP